MLKALCGSALVALCLAALAGCGFEPMPLPDTGGMNPRPGLLTGKSGEFVIYGRP
jgi:hypothetical protein